MRKLPGSGGEMLLATVSHPHREIYESMSIKTQCLSPAKNILFAGGRYTPEGHACCLISLRN